MRAVAIAIASVLSLASARNLHPREYYESRFVQWLKDFEVDIKDGAEFVRRLGIWASNEDYILTHNAANSTYVLGHNQFSHLSLDEFHQLHKLGGYRRYQDFEAVRTGSPDRHMFRGRPTADEIDWNDKGAVTDVKNQGQCGSCWAFSTTGALEGAYYLKNGELVSFSEQQLVDCDKVDAGCNGGLMDNAFGFIKRNGGLTTEEDYPYEGTQGRCQSSSPVKGSAVTKFTDVAQSDAALTAAIQKQPVAVAIEADQRAFQLYSSGVLTGNCGTSLDHGVLAVGYGTQDGTDFYKVKNSWGSSWGDNGYILIERGNSQRGGQCGILMAASFPTV